MIIEKCEPFLQGRFSQQNRHYYSSCCFEFPSYPRVDPRRLIIANRENVMYAWGYLDSCDLD